MGSPSGGSENSGPGGSDNGGGQREAEEAKERKAESFERALDNANRPDRAPAASPDTKTDDDNNRPTDNDDRPDRAAGPPGVGAPPSASPPDTDTTNDDNPDDRSFFDRVADTLTAPPTDAEGNLRSTSPVADRFRNHTVNYSLDDLREVFTPEQSQALADGAAVIDGVVAPTTLQEHISLYQADLRFQQRQRAQILDQPEPYTASIEDVKAEMVEREQQLFEIDRQLANLAARRELVETVTRTDIETGITPEILHFDPKADGQIVVAHGDIRNASHIAVMVPGMTTDLASFTLTNERAKGLLDELSEQPGIAPAVISYLGYDAPDNLAQAVSDDYAVDGAPTFSDFLDALPEHAETHVLAHSYGSLLTGKALAEGARPDYAHVFGSPGIGIDALDELNLQGQTVVTVTINPGDRVVQFGHFGAMPPEDAISYPAIGNPEAQDYDAHGDYFNFADLADIITGRRQPVAVEE